MTPIRTGVAFEAVLARLYADAAYREQFLRDPHAAAAEAGLTTAEADALAAIDRQGLDLASRSFAHKGDAAKV